MDKLKKVIAVLITIAILFTSFSSITLFFANAEGVAEENDTVEYKNGDIIEFGSYPQKKVNDDTLMMKLNSKISNEDWNSFGSVERGNAMQFADIEYQGKKYRAIQFNEYKDEFSKYASQDGKYSDKHYQEINGYYINTVYWFEYESLKWKILDAECGLIICDSIIDAKAFNDTIYIKENNYYCDENCTYFANNYAESSLRKWLTTDFYNMAFNDSEKEKINVTDLNNKIAIAKYSNFDSINTSDKLFIPSARDLMNVSYGFNSDYSYNDKTRIAEISDYSLVQGCYSNTNESRSYWWVRNYTTDSACSGVVLNDNGSISSAGTLYSSAVGVRPALKLNFISDSSEKISIDRDTIYTDSSFINYGSPQFYDSLFEYSNNGMEAYNNRSNTMLKSVDKDYICPTNSKKMIQISTDGIAEPGLGGYKQPIEGAHSRIYYHVIIAKIPEEYRLQCIYNTLYYDAEVNYLTSTKGTGNWELYIVEVKYGVNKSNNASSNSMGYVYLTCDDISKSEDVTWYVGYSNVFDNTGTNVFPYGAFGSDTCSVVSYNNNASISNTVSASRVAASSDCPTLSGYMMKIQTDPGTTWPGLGGFRQAVTPDKGKVYYHKILAKLPKGYHLEHKANAISATFKWLTDNEGTDEWETYVYKVTVDKNATDLNTFGYVALYPNSLESHNLEDRVTISERVVWYVAYSNIYWNYEFLEDLKASDLIRGNGVGLNGHSYIRFDYAVSWHMAKAICEKLGGHLATITSTEENNAIASLCSSQSVIHYWIGATDKAKEGVWKWITREPFSYNKWSSGQPDNYNNGESFLEMWTSDGYWNDNKDSATEVVGFIYEFDNNYIPVKTIEKNRHLYSLFNDKLSWTDAEAACVAMGGHLISITSSDEQLIVENLLKYGALENYWIGATDKDSEGVWKWTDTGDIFWRGQSSGTGSGFSNWDIGEPNNNTNSDEGDYAHIYNTDLKFGKWDDVGSARYGFICEVDTNNINADASYCYNGHKYEIYDKSLSWTDAKLVAEMKGGHLVTITSSDEQDFINSIITGHNKIKYLIGATDYSPDYSLYWRWVTGEKFEYSNWQSGNPDFSEFVEFFTHLRTDNSGNLSLGEWNDTANAQFVGSEYGISSNGFIIEYDNYYSTVAFDENNDSEINYFIAPTIDDGWTLNNDGTLVVKKKGITITYNPSDETFTFDSNGASIPGSSLGELGKCPLYSFDLFSKLSVGQYLTLSSYYVSGSMENSKSCLVLEGITPNKRCATDIISDEICFNSTNYKYPSGPLNSEQADEINQISLWLYDDYELNGSVKFDNYKLKFSVNITDTEIKSPEYSRLAQKNIIGKKYTNITKTISKTGYSFNGWYDEQGNLITDETVVESKTNQILSSSWSPMSFNVDFNANGGICDTSRKTVTYDQAYGDLPIPEKNGNIFLGWYTKKKGGKLIKKDDKVDILNNITLYASWFEGENQKCGNNLIWSLEGNKLIISGNGDMYDFDEGKAPWRSLNSYITEIEIQNNVTKIGDYAFCNLTILNDVKIGKDVTEIGIGAFKNCMQIKNISIPKKVSEIKASTFENCSNIEELILPIKVKSLEDTAIDGCNSIQSITVYNPMCTMPDYWITSNDDAVVYGYSGSKAEAFSYDNDKTFISIGCYGEYDNVIWFFTDKTETLNIVAEGALPDYPEKVLPWSIVKDEIKNVIFDDAITYIGNNTLKDCKEVETIHFPDKLTNLGINALDDTQWFENFDAGIVTAKNTLYAYKEGFEEDNVVLNRGLTGISKNFSYSIINVNISSLKSLQISNTVEFIDEGALAYIYSLENLSVHSGNKKYKVLGNVLYSKDGTQLICYPAGLSGQVIIPDSVTEIRPYAFAGCKDLSEITIGQNITSIGENAFDETNLETIHGFFGSFAQTYAQENGYDFVPITSTVTLDCNDDNGTIFTMTVNTGCPIGDLYVPGREGYTFAGWYLETDDDDILINSDYIVNEDIVLYAYWEEIIEEAPYITGISIAKEPNKTEYFAGDYLDTNGLKLIAQYSNGTTELINNGFYCIPSRLNNIGKQNITVTYSGYSTTFDVNVTKVVPVSLTIINLPNTVSYFVDQLINTKGLKSVIEYNNGTQRMITNSAEFEYVYDFSVPSNAATVNVIYKEDDVEIKTFYQVKVSECPKIYSENIECDAGDEILVPVKISGNTGLMGYIIYVTYNPDIMTPSTPRTSIGGYIGSDLGSGKTGILKVIWYADLAYTGNGELFKIPFKINSKAKEGLYDIGISFSENDTFNENYDDVLLDCNDSQINIKASQNQSVVFSETINGETDSFIDIPIYIENNIGMYEATYITLNYDPSVFSYENYFNGIGTVSRTPSQKAGVLKIRFDDVTDVLGDGLLVVIRLKTLGNTTGNKTISLSIDDDRWISEDITVNISSSKKTPEAKIENVSAQCGDTITIPVSISKNSGIMGYKFSAKYDTTKFSFVGVQCDDNWNNGLFEYNDNNGVIDIIWTGKENINLEGTIFNIILRANDNITPGVSTIYLSCDQTNTFDETYALVDISCFSGQVDIQKNQYIIPYDNTTTEIDYSENYIYNIVPGLDNLNDRIVAAEGYSYTLEKSSEKIGTKTKVIVMSEDEIVDYYTVVLFGDVNGDGVYDGMDAIIVQCIEAGMLTKEQVGEAVYMAADCNHDGVIDNNDVELLEEAGLLLASIDQSKTQEELQTDSVYVEYLNLIEQNPVNEETNSEKQNNANDETENSQSTKIADNDNGENNNPQPKTNSIIGFIADIYDFLNDLINFIRTLLA